MCTTRLQQSATAKEKATRRRNVLDWEDKAEENERLNAGALRTLKATAYQWVSDCMVRVPYMLLEYQERYPLTREETDSAGGIVTVTVPELYDGIAMLKEYLRWLD